MLDVILTNLMNIGLATLIFLGSYLANVTFSLYYNIKMLNFPFDRAVVFNACLRVAVIVIGLTLLCLSITTLPVFASRMGWVIPEEYIDFFSNLLIIGALLMMSCKYIVEAFCKFKDILNSYVPGSVDKPSQIGFLNGGITHDESK